MRNKEEVIQKLESIRVSGDKGEIWNFECAIILNLITDKQKEIDELKEHIRKRIAYTQDLEKDLFENCENYVVSKDKIRDKIKELEEQDELYKGYKGLEFSRTGVINLQIRVLKELLGE